MRRHLARHEGHVDVLLSKQTRPSVFPIYDGKNKTIPHTKQGFQAFKDEFRYFNDEEEVLPVKATPTSGFKSKYSWMFLPV